MKSISYRALCNQPQGAGQDFFIAASYTEATDQAQAWANERQRKAIVLVRHGDDAHYTDVLPDREDIGFADEYDNLVDEQSNL